MKNANTVGQNEAFPWSSLVALAIAGFITILTEALPAGLLPQIGSGLEVSESMAGQLVTIYAIGSLVAAIPLTIATQQWRRKKLLLITVIGFAMTNTMTAISTSYLLTMVARFLAGVSAGLLWAILAGYASRMVSESQRGRAIAVAMVGTPLALSIGIPAGTLLGSLIGWRITFGVISAAAAILIAWIAWSVPDFSGQTDKKNLSLGKTLEIPGLKSILYVTLSFVLAHNILYTYIAPFLNIAGIANRIDFVLLIFGLTALIGIWIVGMMIDSWLRELTLVSTILFGISALTLGIFGHLPSFIYAGVALWGLSFGGAATLFQTASAITSKEAADVAQSMLVTVWNIAIAGGGIIGGAVLETSGAGSLPWSLFLILITTFIVVLLAKERGFKKREESSVKTITVSH